jgi:beta-lactamase regulating signal transducer with metallopeptidase domain
MNLIVVLSEGLVKVLGRTLAHSLWEGVLLAALAGIVLMFTQRSRALIRYNLLVGLLVSFLAGVVITFGLEWQSIMPDRSPSAGLEHPDGAVAFTGPVAVYPDSFQAVFSHYRLESVAFLDDHAALIVMIWLVLLSFKCLKVILDLYYMRYIRQQGTRSPAPFWESKIKEWSGRLKLKRPVNLLESDRIQSPMVMGILKPVILLPLGMMAQLPPGQVEAILLHELAHVYRKDYLVNLLQHLTETIFLFNPAVYWVSSRIREERENCCDDLAMSSLNSKSEYLQALLAAAEFARDAPRYAVAFQGGKGQLLHRVRRILENRNTKTLSYMEKFSLIICLFIFGILALLPPSKIQAQTVQPEKTTGFSYINVEGDGTGAQPQHVTVKDKKGKVYELKRKDHQVVELTVDNQVVPPDQVSTYDWLIKDIDEQIAREQAQAKLDKEQSERDLVQAKLDAEQAQKDAMQAKLDAEQAEHDHYQAKLDAEQAERDQYQAKLDAEQAAKDAAQAKRNVKMSKLQKQQAVQDARQAKLDAEQASRDAAQAKLDAEQAAKDAQQAKLDAEQAAKDAAQAKEEEKLLEEMTVDLINDKIISTKSDLKSFELQESAFMINGVKQPDAVFRKYKAKYGGRWTVDGGR